MKRNNLTLALLLFLFAQFFYGQVKIYERQVLSGRIVSDSTEVENITVFNISTNIGAITNSDGKFSILARAKDTLYFQGISFVSQQYVLTGNDFWIEELEVLLQVKVNQLNEVIVTPSTLTGNLKEDTKKIKTYALSPIDVNVVKYYEDTRYSSSNKVNTSPNHFAPNGSTFNFLAIGRGIGKLLGIKGNKEKNALAVFEERKLREVQSKSFADHMRERFSYHFFVSSLKIKNENIASFFAFAEIPSIDLIDFLKTENELKLIEYLILKSNEFNKLKE
ncbi:MAG: carboxypeptidase-like regulatory domain-containing protein [Flavobacterium sp.]|nr:carboxypeptidase-like regulatory domain-containing protein [Flavobacterium sp.]